MTYRCGIGESMARELGYSAGDPHIFCDYCGRVYSVYGKRGVSLPAKWFLDGKAPPGWKRSKGEPRTDLCPDCKGESDGPPI